MKIMISVIAVLAFIGSIAGCAGPPADVQAQPGQYFSLSTGQTAVLEEEGLRIRFVEMVSDSRCPEGVNCIWEDEVSVLTGITYRETLHQLVLSQPGLTENAAKKTFEDYELSFYVEPYPEAGKEIAGHEYRLHMLISKGASSQ